MDHQTTPRFWQLYDRLPQSVRRLADKNYELLKANPHHPSLHFKQATSDLWSVRVGLHYRALATVQENHYLWFWIGPHAEYDRLLAR